MHDQPQDFPALSYRVQIFPQDILMVVGNGLLFDFAHYSGTLIDDWHPQRPTTWRHRPRLSDGRDLLAVMPYLSDFLATDIAQYPDRNDFERFRAIIDRPPPAPPRNLSMFEQHRIKYSHDMVAVEARHYIVGALSFMHRKLIAESSFTGWRWAEWLNVYRNRLLALSSFNYDLLLETALTSINLTYRRFALKEETGIVGIHKPHGSIDFEVDPNAIFMNISYPLKAAMSKIDVPMVRIHDVNGERCHAEVVLPSEASVIRNFQWVKAGQRAWNAAATQVRHLVLVGISYWACDQEELDALVMGCQRGTKIYMCNPDPSKEWVDKLRKNFVIAHPSAAG